MGEAQDRAATAAGEAVPATVFLGAAPGSEPAMAALRDHLRARGLRVWPPASDGGRGGTPAIQRAVAAADVALLYLSPEALASDSPAAAALPAAVQRADRDPDFDLLPIFDRVTTQEVEAFCRAQGLPSLAAFPVLTMGPTSLNPKSKIQNPKSERPPGTGAAILGGIARRALEAALTGRWRRVGAGRHYEPHLCLRTVAYTPPWPSLDLDLDWTELVPAEAGPGDAWDTMLLPALADVKDALSAQVPSRSLHLDAQGQLPAALACGFALPMAARFTLTVASRDGTWGLAPPAPGPPPLILAHAAGPGDAQVAVVELAVTRDTARGTTDYCRAHALAYGRHLRFTPPEGPGDDAVRDAGHAAAMAQQVGQELKKLSDGGVRHIHLFAALPAALAVLLGRRLTALAPVTVYDFLKDEQRYRRACTLGPAARGGGVSPLTEVPLSLTPVMRKELEEALLSACPNEGDLRRVALYGLDANLEVIAGGANLRERVFNLLEWAEARGKLDTLVAAALVENASNAKLLNWQERYQRGATADPP
ncbi:MAG TPA: SAVED domain-containing protein [Chloroflexia bacterium]|nr:SAVED domain-containing protein [Chloroflexia bacterium]